MIKKIILSLLIMCVCTVSEAASRRLAKYGVQLTIDFELFEVDGVDLRTDWTPAQADCEIMKDEGASTLCDNTATDEGSTYSIVLTATEMQFARGVLKIVDAATKQFLDAVVIIETYGNASALHAFDLDTASVAQSADNDTKISTLITGVELNAGAITDASLAGNMEIVFETDFGTNYNVTRNAWVNNYTDIIGTMGAAAFGADFITSAKIADNAIGAAQIAANAIGASELATDAIGAAQLAADGIDLIWDELMAGHTTADTSGLVMNDWQNAGRLDAILDTVAADVVNLDGSAMIGTNNAATETKQDIIDTNIDQIETTVITNAAGVDIAADIIAMKAETANILIDTAVIGALGVGLTDLGGMSTTMKGQVNTEVDGALNTAIPGTPVAGSVNNALNNQNEIILEGAASGSHTTTTMETDLTVTVNDQYNGRILTFTSDTATVALRNQQTDITDTVTTNGKLTFTALTTAPSDGDKFVIN